MRSFITGTFCLFVFAFSTQAQTWPSGLAGHWAFDDPAYLAKAESGNDLILTGTHTAISGPAPGNGAVAIDTGSHYTCQHGMVPNGGGILVNEYTLLFDVLIANPKVWHCFFQTNMDNSNDGDLFINPFSQVGIGYTDYSGFSLKPDTWYRFVVVVDLGNYIRYFVDGKPVHSFISPPSDIDDRFSLDSLLLFFADDNSEDNLLHIAQVALFSTPLSDAQVYAMGGFRPSNISPYLQSPTPLSIYVSWHSYNGSSTMVQYGTSPAPGSTLTGSFEDIGTVTSFNRWHTVRLAGLIPDTRYHYRCISGNDTSGVFTFRTPPLPGTPGKHIRFLKIGDSQTEVKTTTQIADTMLYQLQQLYGSQWMDSISFVMHTGDIMHLGNDPGRYMNEFFHPYSRLSPYIPFMISIGNHEVESPYYYQFMHYSDHQGFNERYYSFTLGSCRFIALNTNTTYQDQVQPGWLQSQLDMAENDSAVDFVFCYFHHPGHSEVWPASNTPYVENSIYPLQQGYTKLVMNTHGHSHNYERATCLGKHSGNWDFRNIICGGAGGILDRWGMYTGQTDLPDVQISLDHYCFMLVEVDMDQQRVQATLYSLGHPEKPRNLEVLDQWHRYLNQPPPVKPQAVSPAGFAFDAPTLEASPFSGDDSLMSSHFQLAEAGGDFSEPLVDSIRDKENYFWDSGPPQYDPVNLSAGMNLQQLKLDTGLLTVGQTYKWRIRYRDDNLRWSEWSDSAQFLVQSIGLGKDLPAIGAGISPNPASAISYIHLPTFLAVKSIVITDVQGQPIKVIRVDEKSKGNGNHQWDGMLDNGDKAPPGLYFCRILCHDHSLTLRIVRL